MTVYYSLTFLLLAAEMATFCFLVLPLPFAVRKKLFTFLSESLLVAKLAYALKITFIFVAVLFVDAVQRMFRITAEHELAKSGQGGVTDARAESSMAAKKFYAQRNTYLTGFCLFLSVVLTRTFFILLDLVHTQDEYTKLKNTTAQQSRTSASSQDQAKQIEDLKKKLAELEAKDRDFETLKKQARQTQLEYDRLATELNALQGANSNKKSD